MNKELFVQNVKQRCAEKGVKPTVACRESGAGKNVLGRLEHHGIMPSIEKVKMLADYLGCSASDLLGEERPAENGALVECVTNDEQQLLRLFRAMPEERRSSLMLAMEVALRSQGLL